MGGNKCYEEAYSKLTFKPQCQGEGGGMPVPGVLAAVTNYHRCGGLNDRKLFSDSSGGWKFKIREPGQSAPGEGCLPGLQMTAFSLSSHDREREISGFSCPYKDSDLIQGALAS